MTARAQGAVRLQHDAASLARLQQPPAILEGAELDLVCDRRDVTRGAHLCELVDVEVGHPDGAGVAELARAFHVRPCPRGPPGRPVDDVQVDVVHSQPAQAALRLGGGIAVAGIELGRDEHLFARRPAVAQRLADAALVAVGLGSVDMAIPELERPADGVDALRPVGHLPYAQPQQRDFVSVREPARAPLRGCLVAQHHPRRATPARGNRCFSSR